MFKFLRPEFFDVFGIIIFGVILFLSSRALFLGSTIPSWGLVFLFVVSILGLIIDGTIVYRAYLNPKKAITTTTGTDVVLCGSIK